MKMQRFLSRFTLLLLGLHLQTWACAQQSSTPADLKCGAYCLFVALNSLDLSVGDFEKLDKTMGIPTSLGYSMEQMCDAASKMNAFPLAVNTSLNMLTQRKGRFACIALLEKTGHYVCIYDIDDDDVFLVDPPEKRIIPRDVFVNLWNGKAIIVSNKPIEPQSFYKFSILRILLLSGGVMIPMFVFHLRYKQKAC